MSRLRIIVASLGVILALSLPSLAQTSADTAAAHFSRQQIADLQADMAWGGLFSDTGKVPVLGTVDQITIEAIRRYQLRSGDPGTGAISAAFIQDLHDRFGSLRGAANLQSLGTSEISLVYPGNVLTKSKKDSTGLEYSSAKRDVNVQFVSKTGDRHAFDAIYDLMKKTSGKGTKTAVMLSNGDDGGPARFVVYGGTPTETLYASFIQKGTSIMGFFMSWNPKQRPSFINTAVAMALSLQPKGEATGATEPANSQASSGSEPSGPASPTNAEINALMETCAKAPNGAEIVKACSSVLAAGEALLPSNRPLVLFNRAVGYVETNQNDLAIADLDQAIELAPDHPDFYIQRGNAFYAKQNYDRAIVDYSKAIELKPGDTKVVGYRANAYLYKGNNEQALADYAAALRSDPDNADLHAFRGAAAMRLARAADALPDLDFVLSKGGSSLVAADYINHGVALTALGRGGEAPDDFRKAEAMATAKIEAADGKQTVDLGYRALARAYGGNFDDALADAEKYIAFSPTDPSGYHARAMAYAGKKDYTRAIADYSQSISLGRAGFVLRERGDTYFAAGVPDLALADYQAMLKLAPSDTLALAGLAKANQALAARQLAGAGTLLASLSPAPATQTQAPAPAPVALGKRVALVIGNGDYTKFGTLPNPKNDAAKIAETLRKIGFSDVTLVNDVTNQQFNSALQDFAAKADGADWAMVYYAGHGIEVSNTNYLIPVDAKLASDRDVSFETVPLDRVMAATAGATGMRLVILDACRDNPFAANMARKTATRSVSRGLSRVEPDGGTLVVYSAKAGQVAQDGDGANSPFVTALSNDLLKPNVEIGKLFRLVRDDVVQATNGQQEPFTYGSLPGEDFIFNPRN
jgi:tetratricopeptide (TPR) repeat protein